MAVKRNGEWISWTYEEYFAASRAAARGLLAVGLERQRGVGIMGFNSPEMMFSFMASVFAGGLSCGIYPTSSGDTVSYLGTETALNGPNFLLLDVLRPILKLTSKQRLRHSVLFFEAALYH